VLVPSTVIPLALAILSIAQLRAHEWRWGYWVITASIDAESADLGNATAEVVVKVGGCGYAPIHDVSANFALFEPGYTVVVIGPFDSPSAAKFVAERVQPCVPDVYVKFGGYLGEK
jgi:hypothetical protein